MPKRVFRSGVVDLMRRPRWWASLLGLGVGLAIAGCVAETDTRASAGAGTGGKSAGDLLIVDCLLPGQIRRLGSQATYLSVRRPIQTSAQDCEIRGGDYTAYDRANYSSALRVWLPMAQEGDPEAQNRVGEIYEKGLGGAPDYETAAIWYERAAGQRFSRARINLAFLYEKGLGVPADAKRALQLYRDASDLPDAVVIDQAELDQSRLEMDRLRRDLESTRSQLQQVRDEVQRREDELRRRQEQLRRELDENAGARLSPAERARIEEAEQALETQRAELARRQTQIHDLETESRDQRAQLLALRTEGESLREQHELARQQQARTREDLEHYQRLAAQSADELKQTRAELDALSAGAGADSARIATLEEQLAARERRLSQQREETARLEEEAARLRRQLGESKAEREAEQAALQERLDAVARQLAEYRDQLTAGDTALEQARAELAAQAESKPSDAARIAGLERQLRAQQALLGGRQAEQEAGVERLERESADLRRRLEQADAANREQIARLQAQLEQSDQALASYRARLARSSRALARTQTQLDAQNQDRAGDASRLAELEGLLAERERLLAEQQVARQAEVRRLEQESARWQRQLAQSESANQDRLEELQTQLAKARRQVDDYQAQVEFANTELERARADLGAKAAAGAAEAARIAALEERLHERRQSLADYQRMVAQLRSESEDWRSKVKTLERQARSEPTQVAARAGDAEVPLAPPSIQLIEPPLVAVRGEARIPVAAAEKRTIVGKVTAPAGLYAVTVNGEKLSVDAKGLFSTDIRLSGPSTAVNLVAVDAAGKRAGLAFELVTGGGAQEVEAQPSGALAGLDFGRYYALVIGNQNYRSLPKLNTAHHDARTMAELLENRFGFDTTLVLDADRYQILSQLNRLRKELNERDNLVIYYAGHGELDRVNLRGHWLPVDAEMESTANWISNVAVTDILNVMQTRHVLVIADSCYSGALTRSSLANIEAGETEETRRHWLQTISDMRSRTVLSSGGLAPVLDGGGGKHSVFAKSLISVLEELDDVTEGQRIYREVAARVAYEANRFQVEQVPEYAPIKFAGHESGDFLFVPSGLL